MKKKLIKINRAPVLTLWATIVAERLGYDHKSALTLGKAVAGLNAQSKGRRLGIFSKPEEQPIKVERKVRQLEEDAIVALLGRPVPIIRTKNGVRAEVKGEMIDPQSVQTYLGQKFGEDLLSVQEVMESLAKAYSPERLASDAYGLYEKFRPIVPEDEKGWGAKGELDLGFIRSLAK
jgi:hypothetical protein